MDGGMLETPRALTRQGEDHPYLLSHRARFGKDRQHEELL
jgi:hypothetical protein